MYSREIINMFFISQVSGLVENVNIGIYSDTINVINVKLHDGTTIELYLLIPLLVTLTIIQGHSNVKVLTDFVVVVVLIQLS